MITKRDIEFRTCGSLIEDGVDIYCTLMVRKSRTVTRDEPHTREAAARATLIEAWQAVYGDVASILEDIYSNLDNHRFIPETEFDYVGTSLVKLRQVINLLTDPSRGLNEPLPDRPTPE